MIWFQWFQLQLWLYFLLWRCTKWISNSILELFLNILFRKSRALVKVLANVPLCSVVKCVALQMTVIKVLRDCGRVWVLSPSGACADLLLLVITVWLSMLGHKKACMAGRWHRASHGMFEPCTSSYNQSFLNELQEDLIAACETPFMKWFLVHNFLL